MKKKVRLGIISLLLGLSLLSLSLFSYTACEFKNEVTYPMNFTSGIILVNLNKTIFIGSTFNDVNTWVDICQGKISKEIYNLYGENCSRELVQRGIPNRKLIEKASIQFNTKDIDVIEEGLFCFGSKIF